MCGLALLCFGWLSASVGLMVVLVVVMFVGAWLVPPVGVVA
jgi:hypothetical protein